MSDWIVLVDGATVASSPTTYFTLKYKYGRDGANMKYTIYAYATLSSSGSYRCDSAGLQIKLDGTQVLNNTTWKPSKSGSTRSGTGWPVTYENTFTVNNKTSGSTELYVKFWDSQGAADYKKEYTKTLKVSPAGPILVASGASSTVNSFSFTATNSITGSMSKYKIGKVDGSWTSGEISLSNVSTFNVNTSSISGFPTLSPNTNYSGVYRIQAYANDCWGDWLTLTDTNLKTKSLPTSTINTTIFTLKNGTPRVTVSSLDNISKWTYNLKYGSTSLKTEDVTSATYKDILINDTLADNIASKNTSGTGRSVSCSVVVTCVGNGTTYTIATHNITFNITSTYYAPTAPTFSSITDTGASTRETNITTVNITGSNTKFISGHNAMSITITGASFKGGTTLKTYNLSCGNLSTSGTGTSYTFSNVTNSTVGVTVVDNRDFSASRTQSITILPYSKPSFSNLKMYRMDNNNVIGIGTRAKLTATITYQYWSNVSGTNTNNNIAASNIKYRYAEEGTTSWSSWITVPSGKISNNNTGTITININDGIKDSSNNIANFNQTKRYNFQLQVADRLESNESSSFILDTADVLVWKDIANHRVGINKKPDSPYDLDVEGQTRIGGNLIVNGNVSQLKRESGGAWINGRDNAVVRQIKHTTSEGSSWNPVASVKTANGNWTIGNVGNDKLGFSYDTDANYNANPKNNTSTVINMPNGINGTVITTGNLSDMIAWVKTQVFSALYPSGSIYITTSSTFDPNSVFGGTWTRITNDAYLKIVNSSSDLNQFKGQTDHKIGTTHMPSHTHTGNATTGWFEMRKSTGDANEIQTVDGTVFKSASTSNSTTTITNSSTKHNRQRINFSLTPSVQNTGGGNAYYPGYYGVYVWRKS